MSVNKFQILTNIHQQTRISFEGNMAAEQRIRNLANSTFASTPWNNVGGTWHKKLPYFYHSESNALQNLEIWIPPSETSPAADASLAKPGLWVLYIHGGAWRDPLVDSSSFLPTIQKIHSNGPLENVAGYASINYTLSPHPKHPTHPSDGTDPSRNGKHGAHMHDVQCGIEFLQKLYGFGSNYILLGHSCGATLAFQQVMFSKTLPEIQKPKCIVGLNGIYDLPNLIKDAGPKHGHLAPLYEQFTRSAFGDDERSWYVVSPVSMTDWASLWVEGELAVLVQSQRIVWCHIISLRECGQGF